MADWRDSLVWGRRGPGYTDQMLFDLWSIVHFISGLTLWKLGVEPSTAVIILIAFEIIENSPIGTAFFRALPDIIPWGGRIAIVKDQGHYIGDSWGNLIFDVIFGVAGFYSAEILFELIGWAGQV